MKNEELKNAIFNVHTQVLGDPAKQEAPQEETSFVLPFVRAPQEETPFILPFVRLHLPLPKMAKIKRNSHQNKHI